MSGTVWIPFIICGNITSVTNGCQRIYRTIIVWGLQCESHMNLLLNVYHREI